jgi:hypothetical protein
VIYRHTQIGWAMIVLLGGVVVFIGWAAVGSGGFASTVGEVVVGLLLVCLLLFISQTVIVDDEQIQLRMGPGLIRRSVPLEEVRAVDRLRLPWWAVGYGIRMSLNGKRQLWRVSGSQAVDLQLSGERRLLITTDEPDALAAVIRSAVDARGA